MRLNTNVDKEQRLAESLCLSVVIPVYNEEKRIGKTLDRVLSYLNSSDDTYEIIIVNDGSTDNTASIVREFTEQHKQALLLESNVNHGKGFSVRRGMLAARGQYVLFSDADLSTPIEEVEKLRGCLEKGYDIAIGSRGLRESEIQIHQPWYRECMGKIFNLLVQLIAVQGIKDTQCGFKCFKREVIQDIFNKQTITHFSFDVELLWIAIKQGYKIIEIPVRWLNDTQSRVNPVVDSSRMFYDLMKIRINDWKGMYD